MSARVETLPVALPAPETPFRRLASEFFASPVATGSFALLVVYVPP